MSHIFTSLYIYSFLGICKGLVPGPATDTNIRRWSSPRIGPPYPQTLHLLINIVPDQHLDGSTNSESADTVGRIFIHWTWTVQTHAVQDSTIFFTSFWKLYRLHQDDQVNPPSGANKLHCPRSALHELYKSRYNSSWPQKWIPCSNFPFAVSPIAVIFLTLVILFLLCS